MTTDRKPQHNPLQQLADAMMEDILNTPDHEIMEEIVEEFGDLHTFEAKMDELLYRAAQASASNSNIAQRAPVQDALEHWKKRLAIRAAGLGPVNQDSPAQSRAEHVAASITSLEEHRKARQDHETQKAAAISRVPKNIKAAAADLELLKFEANFERDFEKKLDPYETLTLPQGRITFLDDGMDVCVHFLDDATPSLLEFCGEERATYMLRLSEWNPGFLLVESLTPDDMERFIDLYKQEPARFSIKWT